VPIYIVDPAVGDTNAAFKAPHIPNPITYIGKRAADGVPELVEQLKKITNNNYYAFNASMY
jgi:hypothetical protein